MNVDKVLTRLAEAPNDTDELRRTGDALGDEILRQRLGALRAFRAGVARLQANADGFSSGYLTALTDVSAAAEAVIEESEAEVELAVQISGNQRKVVEFLEAGPALPKTMAEMLGKDRAVISRILNQLRAVDVVQGLDFEHGDGRARPCCLTLRGKRLASHLRSKDGASPGSVPANTELRDAVAEVTAQVEEKMATLRHVAITSTVENPFEEERPVLETPQAREASG